VQRSFVQCAETYTETDLLDLFYFHREARQIATRAFDRQGALAMWVVDCGTSAESGVVTVLREAGRNDASYFVGGYVHRLTHPRDLREIAVDMLHRRCEKAITGKEIRPGVWIDEGARVHGRARIVGPAYIGCGSKVRADTLITRSSSLERDCCVDYGTVIEDSSVLPHTHVGIWLDVCHAVADGNRLFSLKRDVAIEILDPSVMRSTVAVVTADAGGTEWNEARMMAADFEREYLTQSTLQWDANLIQE
jgi:NDP-sugar pyrophosphorylase family protein